MVEPVFNDIVPRTRAERVSEHCQIQAKHKA